MRDLDQRSREVTSLEKKKDQQNKRRKLPRVGRHRKESYERGEDHEAAKKKVRKNKG